MKVINLLLLLCSFSTGVLALTGEIEVPVNEQDMFVTHYPATGSQLILWIAPGYGSHQRTARIAARLAQRGIEVWHVDLAESLFLPKNTSTMRQLDGRYVAGLIDAAHVQTGKTITLVSRSYGALPLLKGARKWQQQHQDDGENYLNGAVLFSPELYSTVPSLGLPPVYADISEASTIPIMIYQAGKRSNRWQLATTLQKLRQGGAEVFFRILPGVIGLFYSGDTTENAQVILREIPIKVQQDIRLLNQLPRSNRIAELVEKPPVQQTGLDTQLKPFVGDPEPLPLELITAKGELFQRDNYHGKVTVVNFWASWCPPCVEEIPSLNSLRRQMQGLPFELISVNYAESENVVNAFLKKVDVDFPVLLDTSGRVSANWNVLVYPSTFVISPAGKIEYGVNGAILWDSPEVVERLKTMLK